MKTKEEMAIKYAESTYHPLIKDLDYVKFCDIKDSFSAGFDAGQAQMLEQAAEGFSVDAHVTYLYRMFKEWNKRNFSEDDVTWCEVKGEIEKIHLASRLSAEKIIREKDEEIKKLQEQNRKMEKMIMKMANYIHDEDEEGSLCDEAYALIGGCDENVKHG